MVTILINGDFDYADYPYSICLFFSVYFKTTGAIYGISYRFNCESIACNITTFGWELQAEILFMPSFEVPLSGKSRNTV